MLLFCFRRSAGFAFLQPFDFLKSDWEISIQVIIKEKTRSSWSRERVAIFFDITGEDILIFQHTLSRRNDSNTFIGDYELMAKYRGITNPPGKKSKRNHLMCLDFRGFTWWPRTTGANQFRFRDHTTIVSETWISIPTFSESWIFRLQHVLERIWGASSDFQTSNI